MLLCHVMLADGAVPVQSKPRVDALAVVTVQARKNAQLIGCLELFQAHHAFSFLTSRTFNSCFTSISFGTVRHRCRPGVHHGGFDTLVGHQVAEQFRKRRHACNVVSRGVAAVAVAKHLAEKSDQSLRGHVYIGRLGVAASTLTLTRSRRGSP